MVDYIKLGTVTSVGSLAIVLIACSDPLGQITNGDTEASSNNINQQRIDECIETQCEELVLASDRQYNWETETPVVVMAGETPPPPPPPPTYDVDDAMLARIAQMEHVKTLNMSYVDIDDLSPLSNMTWLEKIHFSDTGVSDISPLHNMQKLELVHMHSIDVGGHYEVLGQLPRLREIAVSINSLSELPEMPQLETLHIEVNETEIGNVDGIDRFSNLKRVSVFTFGDFDYSGLLDLPNLEEAGLSVPTDSMGSFERVEGELENRGVSTSYINQDLC